MKEIWKPVTGYEGYLEVSSLGRVKVLASVRAGQRRPERVYSPYSAQNGYLHIAPRFGRVHKKMLVHRLVAAEFVPGFFDNATVNHIDGNKHNNAPNNLEWVSRARNTALQWETGLVNLRGEKHPSAKLSDADAAAIRERLRNGERVVVLAREYLVSSALIYKIRSGRKRSTI